MTTRAMYQFDFGGCPQCGIKPVRFVTHRGREAMLTPDLAGNMALVVFGGDHPDQIITARANHHARWALHRCEP